MRGKEVVLWIVIGAAGTIVGGLALLLVTDSNDRNGSGPTPSVNTLAGAPPTADGGNGAIGSASPDLASGAEVLIAGLKPIEETNDIGSPNEKGVVEISGNRVPNSLSFFMREHYEEKRIVFSIGRDFRRLRVLAGLRDDSQLHSRIVMSVYLDNQLKFQRELDVGETAMVELDVSNVLHLALVASSPGDLPEDPDMYPAWGDGRLS